MMSEERLSPSDDLLTLSDVAGSTPSPAPAVDAQQQQQALPPIPIQTQRVFRAFCNATIDSAVVSNDAGNIVCCNQKFLDTFGFTLAEAAGASVTLICPPAVAARHDAYMQQYHTTGVAHVLGHERVNIRVKRKDGTTFPAKVSVCVCVECCRSSFDCRLATPALAQRRQADSFALYFIDIPIDI
jgi:two-component system sensor kinase FixL